jgi:hypothetical protein
MFLAGIHLCRSNNEIVASKLPRLERRGNLLESALGELPSRHGGFGLPFEVLQMFVLFHPHLFSFLAYSPPQLLFLLEEFTLINVGGRNAHQEVHCPFWFRPFRIVGMEAHGE